MENITKNNVKDLGIVAGVITGLVVAYYATGLYLNYLQIKKIKKDGK